MSTNHDEQQASPDVQEPEGLRIEASRRQFLQFSAATSAAAAGGLALSAAAAEQGPVKEGLSNRPSLEPTKYLIDGQCHVGSGRPLVVSCGTQQSELLVVVEPGGHVGRLPLSLSICPRGGCQENGFERWSGGAVHQRVGPAAAVGG